MNATAAPVEEFIGHLQVERRMSPHTLDAYRRDLAALAGWADADGIHDLLALQTEQLRAFVAAEHRRGLSPKSLQRRLSACRSFYRWLLRHGRIQASPAAAIRAPKAPRKLPQVLDADEAARLLLEAWPSQVAEPIARDITGVLTSTRGDVLTLGVLFALYFASSGVESLRIGLNRAYGMKELRAWWLLRIESVIYVLVGAVAILAWDGERLAALFALIVTFPHEVLLLMAYTYLASGFVELAVHKLRRRETEQNAARHRQPDRHQQHIPIH